LDLGLWTMDIRLSTLDLGQLGEAKEVKNEKGSEMDHREF